MWGSVLVLREEGLTARVRSAAAVMRHHGHAISQQMSRCCATR
eukprot:CAMPEP_0202917100 /NCGR_PEP_ID=MMETSP1392-20130828/70198_1 /ASSEMBLY_ACC=CAM_ASM_000868 /TAXON_ID=225041 /ORGANISM="Chlamydomonas chlamydogama, Strain SAG 11-48b" /LENGTH=42 /DNA_ID= /DNA_START= /DNA_END= /DNA_ORIENTATION=